MFISINTIAQVPEVLELKSKLTECELKFETLQNRYDDILWQGDEILYQIDVLNNRFTKYEPTQYTVGIGAQYYTQGDVSTNLNIYINNLFIQQGYIFEQGRILFGVGNRITESWSISAGVSTKNLNFDDTTFNIAVYRKLYKNIHYSTSIDSRLGISFGMTYNI